LEQDRGRKNKALFVKIYTAVDCREKRGTSAGEGSLDPPRKASACNGIPPSLIH
jgi:hypothetical protein